MERLSRQFSILALILVGSVTLPGCATKKYVRSEIGKEVSRLEPKIAEANTAIQETKERLDAVDRRAQQSGGAAAAADEKAAAAGQAAAAAAQAASAADGKAVAADRKADTANQSIQQTNTRINALDTRLANLDVYSAGPPQRVVFNVNSDTLSDEAKQTLDSVANGVAGQQSGYLIEIQGFTDETGAESYNVTLSQRRADSVLRYLVGKGIPVHRTSIVGLGEQAPIADNKSREGRQQNRRVEIRILRLTSNQGNN